MATAVSTVKVSEKIKVEDKDVSIVREGKQIILPVGMKLDDAIEWINRKKAEDERKVAIYYEFHYSPLDGAVAIQRALTEIFGWHEMVPTPDFWGSTPPTMIGVPISLDKKMQVPWGRIQIPTIEGFLETGVRAEPTPRFVITGEVKQKHKEDVEKIASKTEEMLKKHSIYKNQAIKVNFEWQRQGRRFDLVEDCPKFMNLSGTSEDDLIFGHEVSASLNIGLFAPIEYSAACREFQVPLKRGVLLYGPYGTGKTLTANVTALKAVKNNWTFIYLDNVQDLKKGLQLAAQYAPAVVFAEDIDRVLDGERSLSMDDVLNTLDGVDTKGGEIISVFSTNHVENINKAVLRPGRLDMLVEVKPPDAEAAVRLVKLYGRGLLAADIDFTKVGEALNGKIPAFIRETTERAKVAAISRTKGADISGKVMEEDLLNAAASMKNHDDMLKDKSQEDKDAPEILVRVPKGVQASRVLREISAKALVNSNGEEEEDE